MSSTTYNHMKAYRVLAYAYFKNKCAECGDTIKLNIHHQDGDDSNNEISNLILLCTKCHKKKHIWVPGKLSKKCDKCGKIIRGYNTEQTKIVMHQHVQFKHPKVCNNY